MMRSKFFLVATLVLVSCGSKKTTAPTTDTNKTDTSSVNPDAAIKEETFCFELKETSKGENGEKMDMTTSIQIVTKGDQVTGTYNEERLVNGGNVDGASGDLKGIRSGDTLKLDFTFTIEGYTQTDETIYLLQGDKMMEKEGEMVEKGDKFVMKDPAKATFKKTYNKVTCK